MLMTRNPPGVLLIPDSRSLARLPIRALLEELGEDLWLFATDWPHGDTAWPESVQQITDRRGLSATARALINAFAS